MHGEAHDTMEALRAALLAMEHRATTAEATVAALMAGAAEEFAALRDAAVADAAAVCERMAQGHDRIAAASSPAAEERHKGVAAALRLAADRIRSLAPQPPPQRPEAALDGATPAPDAPPPAGGLPVAAAGVCPVCGGGGRSQHEGWCPVRRDGRVAVEGGGR